MKTTTTTTIDAPVKDNEAELRVTRADCDAMLDAELDAIEAKYVAAIAKRDAIIGSAKAEYDAFLVEYYAARKAALAKRRAAIEAAV
jgi:hypothetical protein